MIRRIVEYLKNGGPIGYILAGLLLVSAHIVRYAGTILIGLLAGLGISYWSNNTAFILIAMTAGVCLSSVLSYSIPLDGPLGFLSAEALSKDPKKAAMEKARIDGEPEQYREMPHFDKLLKKEQVMDILSLSSFSQYKTKTGKELKNVSVSEDDKWVCIMGGYMPVDLVCGYNRDINVLFTIDGGVIKLPFKAILPHIKREIEAFFSDRGHYYTKKPRKAGKKFDEAYQRPVGSLDKADFSRLRYLWEKANSDDKDGYLKGELSGQKYEPVFEGRKINPAIFERVLSDTEVGKTAAIFRRKKADLADILDFDKYSNEFCVCNAVEVLSNLRYPANSLGMGFLFRCLYDVDEAYFQPAVETLKDFPKGHLKKEIEENVKKAFEEQDVVKLGGLMFLANEIGYDIKYVEEMRKTGKIADVKTSLGEDSSETTETVDITAVPEFDFDETAAFGNEMVQGFAYKKE